MDWCKKLTRIDDLAGCVGLRRLSVSESGDIESLKPLAGLVDLQELYLYGCTKVVDNDLTPLAGLPRLKTLALMNRRGYSPSVQELQRIVGFT